MSLPLPEKKTILVAIKGSPAYFSGYSTDQIQAYGKACREQALEEAINCYLPDDTASDYIEKIKELK